jgi:hypothetical protein
MPQTFRQSDLIAEPRSRHLTSGPHLRVQVLHIPVRDQPPDFCRPYHGEAMVLCLQGRVRVETATTAIDLDAGDQALLEHGEEFRILAVAATATTQVTWTPGPNPCQDCWELNNRFFGE